MRVRNLAALLAALLFAVPAVAQETRGAIDGVVKDAQGAAVPGATIEANSGGGLTVSATTDTTGRYRFPSLPPGKYTVTATMPGFSSAKVQDVRLSLGQLLSVDLTLTIASVTETIEVTVEAPLIEVKQSARSASLRDEALTKVPRGRDFATVATQAPGANQETAKLNGISIDGASSGENRFIIDGAESTNLQTGLSGKVVVTDFIEEVQVKSSGYTAEYGGATGGVINVLTKSGSNSFRGDVGVYYNSNKLDTDSRPTLRLSPTNSDVAEYVTYPEDTYNRLEPGFTVGGPLKKDKIWFFVGYNPVFRPLERTSAFNDGVTRTKEENFTAQYGTANITAQLADNVRARGTVTVSNRRFEGELQALAGNSNPTANYDINTVRPNYSGSLSFDYTPSNKLYLGLRGSYYRANVYNEGIHDGSLFRFISSNVNQAGVPAQYQQTTNFQNVPTNFATTRDIQKRLNGQFDATYFFSAGGEHQLKAGIQLDQIGNEVLRGETGNRVYIYWDRASGGNRGTYGYYRVRSNGVLPDQGFITQGDITSNNVGLFLQDSWTIKNRFTLNLGLRTENESVPSYSTGSDVLTNPIQFGFADKLAPRVGFAWDLRGNGKTKVYASWGMFYDIMKLELPRGAWGGDKWLEYYYTLDTYEWDKLDPAGCPPACPGRLFAGPIDFRHPSAFHGEGGTDPDLMPMRMQESVVGLDHELTNVISASVRYVHKQLDRGIEDVGVLDADGNEVYTIANPGFGLRASFIPSGGTTALTYPKAQRDYDAVELALNKRMSNRWSARVAYLWSRLYGNYSGLGQSDEANAGSTARSSPNVGRGFDYPLMAFDEKGQSAVGLLGTDRTHQAKIQAVYDASFGTSFGLNFYAATGVPKTREAAWNPSSGYPIQYLGRASDGRLPFGSQTDLYLQHEIKLGGRSRLTLSANVLNLFDQKTANNYWQVQLASGETVDVAETTILYQGADFRQLIADQNLKIDPRFLKDGGYQDVREIRLALRLSF